MKNSNALKATKIDLINFSSPQMRAFHMTWFSFFLCFFGWFSFPALSNWVIADLGITKQQFVTTSQWAVSSTIIVRLIIGWLCDKYGPRKTYTWLLVLGALPVALSSLVNSYEQLLYARIFIGAIGASFVITQYHTSSMFAPNIVGTANATSAGWGNLGGGVTQQMMPLFLLGFAFFFPENVAWRYAMLVPAVLMVITGIAYYKLTQDTPAGNFEDIERVKITASGSFSEAFKDYRVWVLFLMYGACFGIELIINSKISLYLADDIGMNVYTAATIGALFGIINVFARTLGGVFGDKFGRKYGLSGRVKWLFFTIFFEGITLILFSQTKTMLVIVPSLILFSLFVQMATGATFSVVPFINKRVLGTVSGIVGAGGNVGAVAGMFLFKMEDVSWSDAFFYLGIIVTVASFFSLLIRFTETENNIANQEISIIKSPELIMN